MITTYNEPSLCSACDTTPPSAPLSLVFSADVVLHEFYNTSETENFTSFRLLNDYDRIMRLLRFIYNNLSHRRHDPAKLYYYRWVVSYVIGILRQGPFLFILPLTYSLCFNVKAVEYYVYSLILYSNMWLYI